MERSLEAQAGEMAALRQMGEALGEYRATLDVARWVLQYVCKTWPLMFGGL